MNEGTGGTSKLMKEAPYGAFFVIPHMQSMAYMYRLANSLGRSDLILISAMQIMPRKIEGSRQPVVVDHSAWEYLDAHQTQLIAEHNSRVAPITDGERQC